jgi:alpha-galactosidase
VSLWAIQAAPLILSGDITRLDEFTLSLLTNDEIIEVDQDPLGKPGYRVAKIDSLEVWKRELEDGSLAVGMFNRGEGTANITALWSDLGIVGKHKVRDLWRQKDLGTFREKFSANVGRHGVMMLRISAK